MPCDSRDPGPGRRNSHAGRRKSEPPKQWAAARLCPPRRTPVALGLPKTVSSALSLPQSRPARPVRPHRGPRAKPNDHELMLIMQVVDGIVVRKTHAQSAGEVFSRRACKWKVKQPITSLLDLVDETCPLKYAYFIILYRKRQHLGKWAGTTPDASISSAFGGALDLMHCHCDPVIRNPVGAIRVFSGMCSRRPSA
jgi:hypothetical protein